MGGIGCAMQLHGYNTQVACQMLMGLNIWQRLYFQCLTAQGLSILQSLPAGATSHLHGLPFVQCKTHEQRHPDWRRAVINTGF